MPLTLLYNAPQPEKIVLLSVDTAPEESITIVEVVLVIFFFFF